MVNKSLQATTKKFLACIFEGCEILYQMSGSFSPQYTCPGVASYFWVDLGNSDV